MDDKMRQGGPPEQDKRGIERMELPVCTIFTIFYEVIGIRNGFPLHVLLIMGLSLFVSWFFYIRKVRSYYFRVTCNVCVMFGNLLVYLYFSGADLFQNMALFATFFVLAGLYSVPHLIYIGEFYVLLEFVIYMVIQNKFQAGDTQFIIQGAIQFANITLLAYVLSVWVNTRNKKTEMLGKSIGELREAEISKDDFLANVSHEIRTPINTICGISEILLQKPLDAELRNQLFYIQTAGRNLTSVVSDILDFSELQSGKIDIVEEEYNISSTVNDIINMSMAKISESKVELIVDCDANLPCRLLGDEKKIRRVIMNVMSNAAKFTEEGCIVLGVNFRKEEYGIKLIITVKDTGIGITPENLERLFSSFTQVDTGRNRKNGGVGLGLAISQIIVRKMGGIITMESEPDKGTLVRIVIPQTVLDESPIVQLHHKEDLNLGVYANLEEFFDPQVRDEYSRVFEKMIRQVQVKSHINYNLAELKRRQENDPFTDIILSISEYMEDPAYFDEQAKVCNVIIVMYPDQEHEISNPYLLRLMKPFYVFSISSVLNANHRELLKSGEQEKRRKKLRAEEAKILVVDDNIMNLKVMEGILHKYGIQVAIASSGSAALEAMENKGFHMVFMDHMMPQMDGVEAMHRIRAMSGNYYKKLPIVALTANAIAGARNMFLEEGFNDFLEKPVEISVLERVLERNLPEEVIHYVEEEPMFMAHRGSGQTEEKMVERPEQEKSLQKMVEEHTAGKANTVQETSAFAGTPPVGMNASNFEEFVPKKPGKPMEKSLAESKEVLEAPEEKAETVSADKGSELVIGDLDIPTGLMYCGGEENLISILQICAETAEENMQKLRTFFKEKNWKEYTVLIHGVKSSMKTVGACKLSDMAKALEQAGKNQDEVYILENHAAMLAEYARVEEFLQKSPLLFDQTPKEETQEKKHFAELDEEVFDRKIQELESAMYEFDEQGMLTLLEELQQYQYRGVALDKPLASIVRKVEMSDLMSAVDTLQKVKLEIEKKTGKTEGGC